MRKLVVGLLAATGFLFVAAPARAAPLPRVESCGHAVMRPRTLIVACSMAVYVDGGWDWGSTLASAPINEMYEMGFDHKGPGRLWLARPVDGFFTRGAIVWKGSRLHVTFQVPGPIK